jgi:hypothetical protein
MMYAEAGPGRPLYLELRASRLKVLVEDGLSRAGGILDCGIVVVGLHSRSVAYASSVKRRVQDNEEELLRLLANEQDPDLRAIRREGTAGSRRPVACVRNLIGWRCYWYPATHGQPYPNGCGHS